MSFEFMCVMGPHFYGCEVSAECFVLYVEDVWLAMPLAIEIDGIFIFFYFQKKKKMLSHHLYIRFGMASLMFDSFL